MRSYTFFGVAEWDPVASEKQGSVMQSLGSSDWPSQASLSSTMHLVFSESDQTEEDTSSEASSEGDVEAGLGKPRTRDLAQSPELHAVRGDQQGSIAESDRTGNCHKTPACAELTSVSATRHPTEGDLAFSRKCEELHGYLRPLLELLNGLKTGRFDRGLSTFQQSVAMDRLQRIVGILQKPHMGEKYLRTLLQVEMMLKVWFPHIAPYNANSFSVSQNSPPSPPPRWHQNRLPVKKRRLSWSDSESQSPALPNYKRTRNEKPEQSPSPTSSGLTSPGTTSSAHGKDDDGPVTSELEDTQDCSISSTTSSDQCQATKGKEMETLLYTCDQVQEVNRVGPKKQAGRKSRMTEQQST